MFAFLMIRPVKDRRTEEFQNMVEWAEFNLPARAELNVLRHYDCERYTYVGAH